MAWRLELPAAALGKAVPPQRARALVTGGAAFMALILLAAPASFQPDALGSHNDAYAMGAPGHAAMHESAFEKTEGGPADSIESIEPYVISDIIRALNAMELFVIVDADHNLIINESAASAHEIPRLDVEIAHEFAVHHNAIISALEAGPVGRVNDREYKNPDLEAAIEDLEHGKFSGIFGHEGPRAQTMSIWVGATAIYPTHAGLQRPDVSDADIVPAHHGAFGTVCGGAPWDRHLSQPVSRSKHFDTERLARAALTNMGYSLVPDYATLHYGYDYAKIAPLSNCPHGFMRDQAIVWPSDNGLFYYGAQGPEPNPDVRNYDWASVPWWPVYAAWWHLYY